MNKFRILAQKIDEFGYNYDTYDYWDTVDDREANVDQLTQDLTMQKRRADILAYLQFFADEDRTGAKEAKELIQQIKQLNGGKE